MNRLIRLTTFWFPVIMKNRTEIKNKIFSGENRRFGLCYRINLKEIKFYRVKNLKERDGLSRTSEELFTRGKRTEQILLCIAR